MASLFSLCVIPHQKITEIIAACGKEDKRVRDLPAPLMVYYVIALNLFPGVAIRVCCGGFSAAYHGSATMSSESLAKNR